MLVFARAPVPGRCKTRLISRLGARGAAALHVRLLRRTLAVACASGLPVELWCAPDSAHGCFHACRRDFGVRLRRQRGGDLGARMAHALAATLARGEAAILVGSDCVDLCAGDLRHARMVLGAADVALQVAADGGYVMIAAASRMEPRALAGIAWSSGRELAQSVRGLERCGLSVALLAQRRDVDTPRDWLRARRAGLLAAGRTHLPATTAPELMQL